MRYRSLVCTAGSCAVTGAHVTQLDASFQRRNLSAPSLDLNHVPKHGKPKLTLLNPSLGVLGVPDSRDRPIDLDHIPRHDRRVSKCSHDGICHRWTTIDSSEAMHEQSCFSLAQNADSPRDAASEPSSIFSYTVVVGATAEKLDIAANVQMRRINFTAAIDHMCNALASENVDMLFGIHAGANSDSIRDPTMLMIPFVIDYLLSHSFTAASAASAASRQSPPQRRYQ